MALMTVEQIKTYLKITDTSLDADIALFEPVAECKVNEFIGCTIETLSICYYPDYSRLVLLLINEASTTLKGGNIKSWSFDGESVSYGDTTSKDNAFTSDQQLDKFLPLRPRFQ
jgi:hypothetical protein